MQDNEILYISVVIFSSISLLGSTFILLIYHKFESLQIFAFKLVYALAFFDTCRALFTMIPTHLYLPDSTFLCQIQGFLLQFSTLSGVLWTGSIALVLYLQVIWQKSRIKLLKKPLFFILTFSTVCSIIPLFTSDYEYVGGWCWISTSNDRAVVYRYGLFYIWLWIVIVFDTYAYFRVINRIKSEFTILNVFLNEGKILVNRLRWYPIILLICYLPLTVTRIVQTIKGDSPFWLLLFSNAFINTIGFANAICYGFNESVKFEMKNYFKNKKDLKNFDLESPCAESLRVISSEK